MLILTIIGTQGGEAQILIEYFADNRLIISGAMGQESQSRPDPSGGVGTFVSLVCI